MAKGVEKPQPKKTTAHGKREKDIHKQVLERALQANTQKSVSKDGKAIKFKAIEKFVAHEDKKEKAEKKKEEQRSKSKACAPKSILKTPTNKSTAEQKAPKKVTEEKKDVKPQIANQKTLKTVQVKSPEENKSKKETAGKRVVEEPKGEISPPLKRVRMKSPSLASVSTDASSLHYSAQKAKAEASMQARSAELEKAMRLAETQAELDGAGMLDMLEGLKEQAEEAPEVEEAAGSDPEPEDGEEEAGEEDEEAVEEEGEADAEPEGDAVEGEEEQDQDESAEGEEEEHEEEDEEVEVEPEGDKAAGKSLATVVEETKAKSKVDTAVVAKNKKEDGGKEIRNSRTHKVEWDRFDREIKNKNKFPQSLSPMLRKSKQELFSLWIDSGFDWDKTACVATRKTSQSQLSRRAWQAVQAKELRAKIAELVKKRVAAGLYYDDEEHPKDEEESQAKRVHKLGAVTF